MRIVLEGEEQLKPVQLEGKDSTEDEETEEEGDGEPPAKRMKMEGHRKDVPVDIYGTNHHTNCLKFVFSNYNLHSKFCCSARRLLVLEEDSTNTLRVPPTC